MVMSIVFIKLGCTTCTSVVQIWSAIYFYHCLVYKSPSPYSFPKETFNNICFAPFLYLFTEQYCIPKYVGMFMFYFHTRFHIPSASGSNQPVKTEVFQQTCMFFRFITTHCFKIVNYVVLVLHLFQTTAS